MNSESEQKYSMEELRQRNKLPKPELEISIPCPTEEQAEILIANQEMIIHLLKMISQKLDCLATRAEQTQTRETLTAIRGMIQPVGKKKERSFSPPKLRLPRLRLPRLAGPTWVVLLMALAALFLLWWGLGDVWNNLNLLFQ